MNMRLILSGLIGSVTLCAMSATARAQIFVTNFNNNTIAEYTTSGALVNPALISGLNGPFPLALSEGNLFVANFNNGN